MAPKDWMNKRVANDPICKDWIRIERGMMKNVDNITVL